MNESANNKLTVFLSAANSLAPSQPFQRDKLLLLAYECAANSDESAIAQQCRQAILQHNQQHMIHRFDDPKAALADPDFQGILKQANRQYPFEQVEAWVSNYGDHLSSQTVLDMSHSSMNMTSDRIESLPRKNPAEPTPSSPSSIVLQLIAVIAGACFGLYLSYYLIQTIF